MKRVPLQANVDRRLAEAVYRLAERDGASVSSVLRESVERYVASREAESDPIENLVGIWADDGPVFDARDLDELAALAIEEATP